MPENFEARVSQNNISESVENDIGNEEAASIREHMASLFREGKNNRILFLRELYIHLDDIADYATITRSKEEREYAAECNTSLRCSPMSRQNIGQFKVVATAWFVACR